MQTIASFITKIIDFFYEKVVITIVKSEKILPREVWRYACCGGSNMVLDWVIYFFLYHLLYGSFGNIIYLRLFHLEQAITPHILAFCITFPITLLTGFWLNKYVTFTQSSLRGQKQLFRYITVVIINILINYFGLKLLVETCQIYPTPSKMIITMITVVISFFGQKYFSFRR